MKIQSESLSACPLCGCKELSTVLYTDKYMHGLKTKLCEGCLLMFTSPMPTEEFLAEFYQNHYRKYYTSYKRPSALYIKRLGRDIRAEYHAAFISQQLPCQTFKRVIDIGAAEGSMLKALRSKVNPSAKIIGVEPSDEFSDFAIKNKLYDHHVRAVDDVETSNDTTLYVMIHVLEHIRDPIAFLTNLSEKMNAEDRIFIDVPDTLAYSTIAEIHIAHLYHFDVVNFRQLLIQGNFEVQLAEAHEPPHHPKSLRIIAKPRKTAEKIAQCFDENRIERRKILDRAIKKIQTSQRNYFSPTATLKRKGRDFLSRSKRTYETIIGKI